MALIDPAYESEILEKVWHEYLAAFPDLKGKYSVHICHTADGARLTNISSSPITNSHIILKNGRNKTV